eukprot:4917436-Pyramimonas_sp.AAC.1
MGGSSGRHSFERVIQRVAPRRMLSRTPRVITRTRPYSTVPKTSTSMPASTTWCLYRPPSAYNIHPMPITSTRTFICSRTNSVKPCRLAQLVACERSGEGPSRSEGQTNKIEEP